MKKIPLNSLPAPPQGPWLSEPALRLYNLLGNTLVRRGLLFEGQETKLALLVGTLLFFEQVHEMDKQIRLSDPGAYQNRIERMKFQIIRLEKRLEKFGFSRADLSELGMIWPGDILSNKKQTPE